jgi:hypothetical protein
LSAARQRGMFLLPVGAMSNTAKISISIADPDLLAWAKKRAEQTGVSLSAVFTEAVRIERQTQARRRLLEEYGPDAIPTPEESAAIRAEWEPLPAVASGKRKTTAKRRAKR